MVREFNVFANGRNDDTRALFFGFPMNQLAHDSTILVIKVADWFVEKEEIEWLTKGSDESDPLLLSER